MIVPAADGFAELMAFHEEMIRAVTNGVLQYQTEDGTWHEAVCGIGIAEFANNRCEIYVDTCEKPEDIDQARAEAALERAQEQLRQKRSIEEYHIARASLARLKETHRR